MLGMLCFACQTRPAGIVSRWARLAWFHPKIMGALGLGLGLLLVCFLPGGPGLTGTSPCSSSCLSFFLLQALVDLMSLTARKQQTVITTDTCVVDSFQFNSAFQSRVPGV